MSIEMTEFLQLGDELWEKKKEVDELKEKLKNANADLTTRKRAFLKLMEEMELEKQLIPGFGTVSMSARASWKTPKDIHSKHKLFTWIAETKGQDVLDAMISINSQTLNSFAKAELDAHLQEGDIEFRIPGLEEPVITPDLRFTKKRG